MTHTVLTPMVDSFKETPGFPSKERINKGPVAIIECEQQIPCNPCETGCPRNAIEVGIPITNLPEIKEDACTGCGLCIAKCPGQAIFLLDMTFSTDKALIAFPYEYVPLPEIGQEVNAVDRGGKVVCTAIVNKIINKNVDKTNVIFIEIDKKYVEEVRSIERL